ncbi:hypothetical protein CTAYLR_002107 [Chrysophaeum taylorii]|uniref:EF-hand domain-containing protein n=1 Tax=Chrysophaeum taylorii TaxID=2483200 RepID=A0AAD7UN70_9STRA|nr:hypothetical protein CTAYLR_002107 [Chrysophaeum taylorii]
MVLLLGVVGVAGALSMVDYEVLPPRVRRQLANCPEKVGWGMTVVWIVVVLYLFLGIAIVCDELFVPALEIIAEKLQLSDDVSGATLMAAGGSAPELATSFFGTFQGSDVGFGTIVGSAVFNVLFVIAMCAVFTPTHLAPLRLTWWPLARDCAYYVLTLGAMGVWATRTSPERIVAWEAAVQFGLYLGYVYLMSRNSELERIFTTFSAIPEEREPSERASEFSLRSDFSRKYSQCESSVSEKRKKTFFRAGIGRLLLGQGDLVHTTGVGIVTQISGDVDATFAQIDDAGKGYLELKDLRRLLNAFGEDPSEDQIEELQRKLDTNGDGTIDRTEFKVWYITSEARLKADVRRVFDVFDANHNGRVELNEIESVIQALALTSKDQARAACESFRQRVASASAEGVTFEEFQNWYEQTIFWNKHKNEAASASKSLLHSVFAAATSVFSCQQQDDDPRASVSSVDTVVEDQSWCSRFGVVLSLPLNLALALTVPDCRVPGRENQCYATFAMSIAWIGAFAYFMVLGIEIIGAQFGIPTFLMGLVFLAAGTSVPDLLSSVVVAKQGKGDMAVSSSIGSNIFDVAVGLPLPQLLYTLITGNTVVVKGTVAVSIAILLGMVVAVILSIAYSGWKMSLRLGFMMLALYLAYLAQEVARALPFKC